MKLRRVVALVVVSMVVIAFSQVLWAQERNWPESYDQYLANVKKTVTVINMSEFRKVFDKKGDAVILDVREPDEYKTGHLPGAIGIPRGVVEVRIWKAVAGYPDKTDLNKKIYVYCATGGRAVLTTKSLKDIGFTNVTAVDMRIADWIKAGYPLER